MVKQLSIACFRGRLEVVKELLKHGADPHETTNFNHDSTLHYAAQNGHLDILKLMLDLGVQMTANDDGEYPIHRAASGGHVDVVVELLGRDVEINVLKDRDHKFTPLLCAVNNSKELVVMELLKRGANPHIEVDIFSSMMLAAASGNITIVKELVKAGCKVKFESKEERKKNSKIIFLAIENGNTEALEFLLQNGATCFIEEDLRGKSPLEFAIKKGRDECAALLVKYGATPVPSQNSSISSTSTTSDSSPKMRRRNN